MGPQEHERLPDTRHYLRQRQTSWQDHNNMQLSQTKKDDKAKDGSAKGHVAALNRYDCYKEGHIARECPEPATPLRYLP